MNKINIITLGCSKNLVDSEFLATYIEKNGVPVIFDASASDANIVVINTCGFIHDAKQESIDTILQAVEAKKYGDVEKVYVMGCLSERYKHDIASEIPELDGVYGVNEFSEILRDLKVDYRQELYGERKISTPSHYAYLKIAEGCDRRCSFCAIPAIRGRHISKTKEQIINEAKGLISKGVKEILLISQDTSYYGKDLYGEYVLNDLLEDLAGADGLQWLRLHYLYPAKHIEKIVDTIARYDKICNYVDIPFQHISDKILKSMRRGHDEKMIRSHIDYFKKKIPSAALRTTFIVGYPGETDKDFRKLLDFVKEVEFDRLGVFTYSEEEGTKAAELPDDVPEDVKQERMDILMEVQREISLKKNEAKVGKIYKVLIDRQEGDYFVGRTEYDSPEVDNEVLVQSSKELKIGEFVNVRITSADYYDLTGEVE